MNPGDLERAKVKIVEMTLDSYRENIIVRYSNRGGGRGMYYLVGQFYYNDTEME